MRTMDWEWLAWQFGLPVLGPGAITGLILGVLRLAGGSIGEGFLAILDRSPWALVSYALTLAAGSLRERSPRAGPRTHPYYGALVVATMFDLLFYAVVVLRRDAADFSLGGSYVAAALLTAGSVYLCHKLRRTPQR